MGHLRLVPVLILLAALPAGAQPFPIQVHADHPGKVLARVQGESDEYLEVSPSLPAVVDAKPGQRVDIRVVGRANWWSDWTGEQQGCTGPSNITIRLEKTPAWERVSLMAAGLVGLSLGGFLLWKRRTARVLADIERRAVVAESGTGIPKQIAGYRIVKLIGEGGMAHVYHGQDRHGRDFAVKIPKTVDERFQRECVIATTLDSPHIVKAFDFYAERSEGKPAFMAQEMLIGQTLQDRLDDNPEGLPLSEVDSLVTQLLDGLEAAHKQGILHRDLKPENLFLDRSSGRETLKILDFGVARADDALLVTVSGAMLGTAIYSSPEQNRSDKLDHRSDLYSVGLIVYEMLTGRRTWSALNRYELLKLHNAGLKTEVVALRADVPTAWNSLISDLLSTDPDGRPSDVAELRLRWVEGRP
jgi:hypothetical protein